MKYVKHFKCTNKYFQLHFLVLGVDRDTMTKAEVGKIYRKMAGKWHPDRFKTEEDKEAAEKKFMQIAAA